MKTTVSFPPTIDDSDDIYPPTIDGSDDRYPTKIETPTRQALKLGLITQILNRKKAERDLGRSARKKQIKWN
jgi:hypothetical protein